MTDSMRPCGKTEEEIGVTVTSSMTAQVNALRNRRR